MTIVEDHKTIRNSTILHFWKIADNNERQFIAAILREFARRGQLTLENN